MSKPKKPARKAHPSIENKPSTGRHSASPASPENVSRRNLLKLGIAAGLGATGGAAALWNMARHKADGDVPLEDTPITQQEIDKEYADLYNYLSQAKQAADAENKKLIILGGEVHNNRNSLLLQFMLVDIAKRLGITEMAEEQDQSTLSRMEEDAQDILNRRDFRIVSHLRNIPDPAVADFTKRVFIISQLKQIPHEPVYSIYNPPGINNTALSMMTAKDNGMHFHAIDPKHEQRYAVATTGDQSRIFTEEFETPMRDAICAVAKDNHVLGFLGAGHVPEFTKKLKQEGLHVAGIDCSGGVRFNDADTPPIIRQRMEALNDIYVPKIKSRMQLSPAEALAMTFKASIKHQHAHEALKNDIFTIENRIIDSVAPKGTGINTAR